MIYLDNAATTKPCDEAKPAVMKGWEVFGNPSSLHSAGLDAELLVSDAREIIAQKKEVISRANRIIAISENTKRDIIELLHINPDKIDVIYHSTSMKPFTGKQSLELPNTFLLFVGDRNPYKNFDRLARVFSKLSAQNDKLFLVCTGMPFNKTEKAFINKLNISLCIFPITVLIFATYY